MEKVNSSIFLEIHAKGNTINENNLPSEIMLLPVSPAKGRDGRKFSYKAEEVINGFKAHAKEIPIDTDHASETGSSTAAAGWIKSLSAKEDGIYGVVEWNSRGRQLLEDKVYKYISPAFYTNKKQEVQYLSSVALTNHPNLTMPALNNVQNDQPYEEEIMEEIKEALGLDTEANETVVLNAINQLKINSLKKDATVGSAKQLNLNNFVPKVDYELVLNSKHELELELNSLKAEILHQETQAVIEAALNEGRIEASSKEYYLQNCRTEEGLESTKAFLASRPALNRVILADKSHKTPILNSLNKDEQKLMQAMGLTEEEMRASKQTSDYQVITTDEED